MKYLLIGNPNCGKSTLFNKLTSSHQAVGNVSGLTVERKSGEYGSDEIIDLPGIYSLDCAKNEESAALYELNSNADGIINIVDATRLERSLFLTSQLLRLNKKLVVVLNMRDELEKSGAKINVDALQKALGVPVVSISALKDKKFDAVFAAFKDGRSRERGARFLTSFEMTRNDRECYENIEKLVANVTVKGKRRIGEKLDKIILNKYLAFPIFFIAVFLIYMISIQVCGRLVGEALKKAVSLLSLRTRIGLESLGVHRLLISLVCDGIYLGLGEVLKFVPQLFTMFVLLSALEDCGYLPRAAFITDRLFNKLGMSGKTAIALILGCGCTVPAVLAARTIDDERAREKSIFLLPFLPCGAKLPLFALLSGTFFPSLPFVAPLMYFVGLFFIGFCGALLKNRADKNAFFVLEIPSVRIPSIANIRREVSFKLKAFFAKTGTVVFLSSVIVWTLTTFSFSFRARGIENSMLASLGKIIAPIFYPIGFTDWRLSVAVLSGLVGKEAVLSTLSILSNGNVASLLTPLLAFEFMLFILLSPPCIIALSTIFKELKTTKKFLACVFFQCCTAFAACLFVNAVGSLIKKNFLIATLLTLLAILPIILYNVLTGIKSGGMKNAYGHRNRAKRKNTADKKNREKIKAKADGLRRLRGVQG